MLSRRAVVSVVISVAALLAGPTRTRAEVICSRVLLKRNKVTQSIQKVASGRPCPKGFTALLDTASIVGTPGERGPAGSDAPSIYGDGSAGDFVATSGTNFLNPVNPQYANFTVGASSTVFIASGSVIRVSGVLRNEGVIFIDYSSNSGFLEIGLPTGLLAPAAVLSDQGIGLIPPGSGEIGNILGHRRAGGGGGGGLAGSSYPQGAAPLFLPGLRGGASGAPNYSGASFPSNGGPGGGSAVFLVGGAATNSGNMRAMGEVGVNGSGGGAGGILIIASATSISNSGSVTVQGSAGGNSIASAAPGGGGGGGLVKFIAPSITNSGTVNISGGAAGTRSVTTASVVPVSAGSGGGGSAGSGGSGGAVNADNSYGLASAGLEGNFISTQMDPAIFYR